MRPSLMHMVVLLLIVFIIFGAGKLPDVMAKLGEGVRNFKRAMNDTDANKPQAESKEEKKEEKKEEPKPPSNGGNASQTH